MAAVWQVAALKLECEGGCFERDPEGLELAAAINRHLPEQVGRSEPQIVCKFRLISAGTSCPPHGWVAWLGQYHACCNAGEGVQCAADPQRVRRPAAVQGPDLLLPPASSCTRSDRQRSCMFTILACFLHFSCKAYASVVGNKGTHSSFPHKTRR